MAEGDSATFGFLSLAITCITKFVIQISPLLYPQMIGLVGLIVKSSIAKIVEIHNVKKENGMMIKYPVKFVEIPAGKTQELKPVGLHLMLMKFSKTLKVGEEIEFMLHFKNSGMLKVIAPVKEGKPMKHEIKHD